MDGGLFPYTRRYLGHLNNHFSTIGICGMNECVLNFLGKDIADPEGADFAEEVLEYMRRHLSDLQEDTGDLFNLEATPAESTSYRLAKHDRETYADIMASGENEPYYTSSTQLPVDYSEDVFEALDHQDRLQTKYTGGTVFHAFLGEAVSDWEACSKMVKTIAYTYHLPYFTISPTYSICPTHGYLAGEHFTCPRCGAEAEVYSRIVGYYRSVRNWNKGKQEEYKVRKLFAEPDETVEPGTAVKAAQPAGVTADEAIDSYILFYRQKCPNCPPVRQALKESSYSGREVNADSPEGLQEALSLNVMAAPTVILLNADGEETGRAYSAEELKPFLSASPALSPATAAVNS